MKKLFILIKEYLFPICKCGSTTAELDDDGKFYCSKCGELIK